ncbi:hypothetical protein B9Z55_027474 [Caenorhabditis nigoni]|uniref:Uncharacterized protein n=1 Tax=Caenorhabditis nigoni TaxID=1611254 RepID=A0A2G5SFM0_9PELO|nr:hypothetical protein B9Z55_027474 [Caenorhabditis nigoni]
MSHLESPSSQKEGNSLISKELKKGFANFSDRLRDYDLPETFKSDEISKLEKLEDKLKKKKEVLESRTYQRKKEFWEFKRWLLFMFMISVIFPITAIIFPPKDQPPHVNWISSAFTVAAVIYFFLLGCVVIDAIMEKKTIWKRRRNTTKKVSVEDGDEKNERIFFIATDYDDLMNRYRKLIKDVNENFEPMRNRCKSLFNQYIFSTVVGNLATMMIIVSTVIEMFFYNPEHAWLKTFLGILQLFNSIFLPVVCYCAIRSKIAEENEVQF